jgi:hypothetical protein
MLDTLGKADKGIGRPFKACSSKHHISVPDDSLQTRPAIFSRLTKLSPGFQAGTAAAFETGTAGKTK